MLRRQLPIILTALLALVVVGGAAMAQESDEAAEPLLSIEEISIQPQKPAADTLCQLRVKVGNRGTEIASQLAFRVTLNGQDLGVYGNQLFMFPVEPDGENEIRLYNFWTTETSRPTMPANGKMTVEVTLTEARWVSIETDDEGVEVWTPISDVTGLPVSRTITLETQ